MKSCAVIGGSGFVGKYLVRLLVDRGEYSSIRVIDINVDSALSMTSTVVFIKCDVRDKIVLEESIRGVDAVFHLAAVIDWKLTKNPFIEEINVRGTENVVAACMACGVKRLIQTSTSKLFYTQILITPRCLISDLRFSIQWMSS